MYGSLSGIFDMWAVRVGVFIVIWPLLNAESSLHFEYTNGWIPVSGELVYNQIKREAEYNAGQNTQLHTNINKALSQNIPTIPEEIFVDAKEVVEHKCHTEDLICIAQITNKAVQKPEFAFLPNAVHHSAYQNDTDHKLRRSKKIADLNFKNTPELFIPGNSSPKYKDRTYEVTEDTLELDEPTANNKGYKYELPKEQNQTSRLFEILSKYRINKDDKLQNYVLSRKPKVQIPSEVGSSVIPHNQDFSRYNHLNHLPVDPILAVLLSNYGFYLRGMYGVQNRYKNLYGYLASNNIHNNRPFGAYKIYSDTDSSN